MKKKTKKKRCFEFVKTVENTCQDKSYLIFPAHTNRAVSKAI